MIRNLKARVLFKITPPIKFNFEFYSVRLSGDMPDFKAAMLVDKFGKCSTQGPVLYLEEAEMQGWSLSKSLNNLPSLDFQVAGRTFHVSEGDVTDVFNYFLQTLPHLWKDASQTK